MTAAIASFILGLICGSVLGGVLLGYIQYLCGESKGWYKFLQ